VISRAVLDAPREHDERFMREALAEALRAEAEGEVPVGCVIVHEGQVIARGHNLREQTQDPTTHAEVLAIRDAARAIGSWRLSGCEVYVTLEPCPMCAGALVNARVDRVIFATEDPKAGATVSLFGIGTDPRLNHRFAQTSGVLKDEASQVLKEFFGRIRRLQKEAKAQKKATEEG
jgi:tRNA(adenine34) deaminase